LLQERARSPARPSRGGGLPIVTRGRPTMIEVRSGPLGQCVHATRDIRAGEFVIDG